MSKRNPDWLIENWNKVLGQNALMFWQRRLIEIANGYKKYEPPIGAIGGSGKYVGTGKEKGE